MTDVAFRCSVVRSVNPISFMRDDKCPRLLTSNDIKGIYIHCMCGQGLEEVGRTEIGKKIKEGMEEAAKTAKTSAESVSKSGEMLGKTGAFRAISQVWSHCSAAV